MTYTTLPSTPLSNPDIASASRMVDQNRAHLKCPFKFRLACLARRGGTVKVAIAYGSGYDKAHFIRVVSGLLITPRRRKRCRGGGIRNRGFLFPSPIRISTGCQPNMNALHKSVHGTPILLSRDSSWKERMERAAPSSTSTQTSSCPQDRAGLTRFQGRAHQRKPV